MKISLKILVGVFFLNTLLKPEENQQVRADNVVYDNWELIRISCTTNANITALAFSSDERYIASAGFNIPVQSNAIQIWSTDGNLIKTLPLDSTDNILDLKFSPDSNYLASSGSKIQIWDVRHDFRCILTIQGIQKQICPTIAFLPNYDTTLLAAGYLNGIIKIFNILTGELIYSMHTNRPINSMSFSPDIKNLTCGMNISFEGSQKLNVWNLETHNPPKKIMYGYEDYCINSVRYSKSPYYMGCILNPPANESISDTCKILIYSINFQDHANPIKMINQISDSQITTTFDFLSKNLLVAGYSNGLVKIWNFHNSELVQSWLAHTDKVNKILYMPNNNLIISTGNDGNIIWYEQDNEE